MTMQVSIATPTKFFVAYRDFFRNYSAQGGNGHIFVSSGRESTLKGAHILCAFAAHSQAE
jgi:hypothetical protein